MLFGGRLTSEARDAIGMFVTDLYAWADLSDNPPVGDFLSRVQKANADALLHGPCPADLMPPANDVPVINYFPRASQPGDAKATFLDEMLESHKLKLSPRPSGENERADRVKAGIARSWEKLRRAS